MDAENPIASSHVDRSHMPGLPFLSPLARCTRCNAQPTENGRNVVVCIDGTSNEFGDHNTNVVKLFAKIDLTTTLPEQRAYYSSGIGTDITSGTLARASEMVAAWTIDKIIKETYSWLAQVYQEGDQIYLFGFSRGAYQVRVLASMIHEVGLIRTRTDMQVTRAYDYYKAAQRNDPEARHMARKFKSTFSWTDMRVHFVGVWDTVCSVGLLVPENLLKGRSPAEHACHFRHALALDERRAKFKPEYLHEVNSWTNGEKSKYIVTSTGPGCAASSTSKWPESTMYREADFSLEKEKKAAYIKEVWFAGCHSDVGGLDRSGKSHAGNVSLLWMRREAAASGLVLQPTDIVWVPDDINLGVTNSMTGAWRYLQHFYDISNSPVIYLLGVLPPLQQSRCIIPGQKVHASISYANAYIPWASLGYGYAIPVIHSGSDVELENQIWETGLFDDTAAQELISYLDGPQAVGLAYLDRLLFMLISPEGKHCIRNVPDWENRLLSLIQNPTCAPSIRLGAAVAYYEASVCDTDTDPWTHAKLLKETFDNDMKDRLSAILVTGNYWDRSRVVALVKPLTTHPLLLECILTGNILESLLILFDEIISQPDETFMQVMDGLTSLLQCEGTRRIIIQWLDTNLPLSNAIRLSLILENKNLSFLAAALCMVMTLVRIPEVKPVCRKVKTRLRQLAEANNRLVGLLSAEILLILYDPNEHEQLSIRRKNARANLAEAFARLNSDRSGSGDGEGHSVGTGRHVLCQVFGVGATVLTNRQKILIRELKNTLNVFSERQRTAATLTILKLCNSDVIRTFLLKIGLLDVLINQLTRRNGALLAAYALATCLKYDDMKRPIQDDKLLPEYIVEMLRHDSFHGAVCQVEGCHIFRELMQHADLRKKIKNCNITGVLGMKLARGSRRGVQMSLICLDIFQFFDKDDFYARELVAGCLDRLRLPDWRGQKVGVTVLSALAQTDNGVEAIMPVIHKIIEMLLPKPYVQLTALETSAADATSTHSEAVRPVAETDATSRPPSRMMGPAWALRILALNEELRQTIHSSPRYDDLKHLYLSGKLFDKSNTPWWRVYTPNRADVVRMLDQMIKAIDQKQKDLMFFGDAVLPNVSHWENLLTALLVLLLPFIVVLAYGVVLAIATVLYPILVPCVVILLIIICVRLYQRYQMAKTLGALRAARMAKISQARRESDPGSTTDVHIMECGDSDSDPRNGECLQAVVVEVGGEAEEND